MEHSKVSVEELKDYHRQKIFQALKKSLDLLGGIQNIIPSRSKVFVKINHLSPPSPPSKAIITHPSLTREFLRLLKDLDCQIVVGDDIQSPQKNGYQVSGYRQICQKMGVDLVNLKEKGFREIPCSGEDARPAMNASGYALPEPPDRARDKGNQNKRERRLIFLLSIRKNI